MWVYNLSKECLSKTELALIEKNNQEFFVMDKKLSSEYEQYLSIIKKRLQEFELLLPDDYYDDEYHRAERISQFLGFSERIEEFSEEKCDEYFLK